MRVALMEGDKLGGTCLHRGCTPTKALLHWAEVADTLRRSSAVGLLSSLGSIDMSGPAHEFNNGVSAACTGAGDPRPNGVVLGRKARAIRRLSSPWPRFRRAQMGAPPVMAANTPGLARRPPVEAHVGSRWGCPLAGS